MKRRRFPPPPPPGYLWMWGELASVETIEQWCGESMTILDALPAVVRNAVHEARAYTDTSEARRLTRRHGPEKAAQIILSRRERLSIWCALRRRYGAP